MHYSCWWDVTLPSSQQQRQTQQQQRQRQQQLLIRSVRRMTSTTADSRWPDQRVEQPDSFTVCAASRRKKSELIVCFRFVRLVKKLRWLSCVFWLLLFPFAVCCFPPFVRLLLFLLYCFLFLFLFLFLFFLFFCFALLCFVLFWFGFFFCLFVFLFYMFVSLFVCFTCWHRNIWQHKPSAPTGDKIKLEL